MRSEKLQYEHMGSHISSPNRRCIWVILVCPIHCWIKRALHFHVWTCDPRNTIGLIRCNLFSISLSHSSCQFPIIKLIYIFYIRVCSLVIQNNCSPLSNYICILISRNAQVSRHPTIDKIETVICKFNNVMQNGWDFQMRISTRLQS